MKATSLIMREADWRGPQPLHRDLCNRLFTHMNQLSPAEKKSEQNLIIFFFVLAEMSAPQKASHKLQTHDDSQVIREGNKHI